jgi:hypothetical protein
VSAHDPPRLLDPGSALDPRLRTLLQAGREELPSAVQLERIARRLGPDFAAPGLEPPVPVAATPSSVAIALVVTAVGVVAIAWWAPSPGATPTTKSPASQSDRSLPPPVQSPAPAAPTATRASRADAGRAEPQTARTGLETESARPRAAMDRKAARARSAEQGSDPVDELLILDQAQHALQSDPERALAHAQRHRLRFPDGHYAQEREVIAIDALLELQRFVHAQRRAHAFLKRYPGSSYRTRVTAQLERADAAQR